MTFDELVTTIAKDKEIPVNQAKAEVLANYAGTYEARSIAMSESDILAKAQAATFATYYVRIETLADYKPTLAFYCEMSVGGGYRGIVSLVDVTLIRAYNNISKNFSGKVYTNLESANTIYYYINGDFYNTGDTTQSGGGKINIGGVAEFHYTATVTTNWYANIYSQNRMNIYN